MSATSPTDALSYYSRPIIKEPVWKSDIPLYFFTGGLAGASDLLALGAQISGNQRLRTSALAAATFGTAVSPFFLIKDLGRPLRFLNMLRVVKVTSPMSVGTWIFSAESATTGIAAGCQLFGVMPRVRATAHVLAGLIGPAQATYTAALIAQSVVPAWHEARRELPVLFASSAAASAGGAAAILTPVEHAAPARRLGIIGAGARTNADGLGEFRTDEVHADAVVGGNAGRKAIGDEPRVDRPPQLLAVVVWTGAAGNEAESVAHARELWSERVGDPGFEPADHPGAPAGEHDPGLPGLAEEVAEPVHAPDRKGVRRVAAADEDDVGLEDEVAQIVGGPGEERQVARNGAGRQQSVDAEHRVCVVSCCCRDDADSGRRLAGQADDVRQQPPGLLLGRAGAAEAHDLLLRHPEPV